jgi:hypothetical protein
VSAGGRLAGKTGPKLTEIGPIFELRPVSFACAASYSLAGEQNQTKTLPKSDRFVHRALQPRPDRRKQGQFRARVYAYMCCVAAFLGSCDEDLFKERTSLSARQRRCRHADHRGSLRDRAPLEIALAFFWA